MIVLNFTTIQTSVSDKTSTKPLPARVAALFFFFINSIQKMYYVNSNFF